MRPLRAAHNQLIKDLGPENKRQTVIAFLPECTMHLEETLLND